MPVIELQCIPIQDTHTKDCIFPLAKLLNKESKKSQKKSESNFVKENMKEENNRNSGKGEIIQELGGGSNAGREPLRQ